MKRTLRAWTTALGVVLMASGAVALLAASPAQAADADTTLTFTPAKGTDVSVPKVTTAAPCPAEADEYIAYVTGPDAWSTQPQLITTPAEVNLSHEEPFDVQLGQSIHDITFIELGLNAMVPGYYKIDVTCRDKLAQTPFKVFSGYLHYYTQTAYQTGANVFPGSTTEVIPSASPSTSTSPTPSASTSTSASATPDPTATTDPTTDPTDTASPTATATTTPAPTTSTSPVSSSGTLPVTGPPAGGFVILGIVMIILGGCVVLGTMRFDRPQPARW